MKNFTKKSLYFFLFTLLFFSCGNSSEKEWSESMQDTFMSACAVEPAYEGYCSCILEELMAKYTMSEASTLTAEDFANFETFDECLSLIE